MLKTGIGLHILLKFGACQDGQPNSLFSKKKKNLMVYSEFLIMNLVKIS